MSNNVTFYVCGYEHCKFSSNKKSKVRDHTVHHVDDIVKLKKGKKTYSIRMHGLSTRVKIRIL
jgi:hypothetical protein